MKDLQFRSDIDHLVKEFYKKLLTDPVIGFFFTEVVQLDLDQHLPKIADFWETTLFHRPAYKGNPIPPHLDIHLKSPLTKEHFDRWVVIFCETVNEEFAGPTAELAKQRAHSIATVMLIKIKTSD